MPLPNFRFTFFHATLAPAGQVVNEPLGWKQVKISLTRDPLYHSLIENFKGDFIWFGEAREFIRTVEDADGPDYQIGVLVEIKYSGTWENLFKGKLDGSGKEDISKVNTFYKYRCPIIRDDFWAKFINHKATPVNLSDPNDIYGNARETINPFTLNLPSQKIDQKFIAHSDNVTPLTKVVTWAIPAFFYASLDVFTKVEIDEINNRNSQGNDASADRPILQLFQIQFKGDYLFNVIVFGWGETDYSFVDPDVNLYIQKNNDAPIIFSRLNNGGNLTGVTRFSYSGTLTLLPADQIRLYFINTPPVTCFFYTLNNSGPATLSGTSTNCDGQTHNWFVLTGGSTILPCTQVNAIFPADAPNWALYGTIVLGASCEYDINLSVPSSDQGNVTYPSFLSTISVVGSNVFPDSTVESFRVHEAGNKIIDAIVGQNVSFYSKHLGNPSTQIVSYADFGCGSAYSLQKGVNVKGYTLAEKPFYMSWDDWFNGLNPCLNLCVMPYEVAGVKKIRVEEKSFCYNPTVIVTLIGVNVTSKTYDEQHINKNFKVGFQKWSALSASGIDDPQTVHNYSDPLKTVGTDISMLSTMVAASLAIEQTRRQQALERSKDWTLDNNIILISLNKTTLIDPELNENFTAVSGLLNFATRYNVRLSAGRIFKRWQKFYQGCLQPYTGNVFKYAGGEGNTDMSTTLAVADCEGDGVAFVEKQNIVITAAYNFKPNAVKADCPMTWETYKSIRGAKENAIGINGSAMFIFDLDFAIVHGHAELNLRTL